MCVIAEWISWEEKIGLKLTMARNRSTMRDDDLLLSKLQKTTALSPAAPRQDDLNRCEHEVFVERRSESVRYWTHPL